MKNDVFLKDLDDLLAETAPPPVADDELTIMRLARHAKIGEQKAARLMAEWLEAGRVEYAGKRRVPSGHTVDAWKVKKGTD